MAEIKITKYDLAWNYLGYGVSFLGNLVLLPILLKFLPEVELGLWYVFLSINSLIILMDFGFTPQISRQINYLISGLKSINKKGYETVSHDDEIDYVLLNKVLLTAKYIYLLLAVVALIILTLLGFFYIKNISEGIQYSGISWMIFSLGCFVNLYYYYYSSVFKGIGAFVSLNKALVLSKLTYIVTAILLLYLGYGILGVSFSFLFGNIVFRLVLSFYFKKNDKILYGKRKGINYSKSDFKDLFSKLFYNSSRDGLVMISRYGVVQANVLICSYFLGLKATAAFGLSLQILNVVSQFALIFYSTIMPQINQLRVSGNTKKIMQLFSASWVVFVSFYILAVGCFILVGPFLFDLLDSNTKIDFSLFILLAVYILLEANHSLFASLISTSNKLPYVKAFVLSSAIGLLLSLSLVKYTNWGVLALIGSHLVVQLSYNNWKWISYVFKEFNVGMTNFVQLGVVSFLDYFNLRKTE